MVRLVQFRKAYQPMEVTFAGREVMVRLEIPLKA
jgi:hypothetical protein